MGACNLLSRKAENSERIDDMMKCNIIRDLFPSYIDNLTSEESNQMIEEHLEECRECQTYLDAMKKEIASETYIENNKKKIKENIRPFKKMRRVTGMMIVATICICVLLFGAYELYFEKGRAADFNDVKITYEKTGEVVTIGFLPKNDKIYIDTFVNVKNGEETGISIMRYRVNPFRMPIRIGGYYGVTFVDEDTILDPGTGEEVKLTGEETVKIEFADTTKEVRIKDLYTKEGIEQIK